MIIWQRYQQKARDRAQEVVLSVCVWDGDERILLTAAGMLPSQRITKAYFDEVWEEEFQSGHPVFCWIYRVSRNWKCVTDLIPGMRAHVVGLRRTGALETQERSTQYHKKMFQELFCLAAAELAHALDEPLDRLGVLYERVVATGTVKRGPQRFLSTASPQPNTARGSVVDAESLDSQSIGRGQVCFSLTISIGAAH